jgi:polar amino acid transport system substrate-binding protein
MLTRRTMMWAAGGMVPLLSEAQARAESRPLRFALGQSWGEPWLMRSGSRVLGGILPDLMTAIAAEMGTTPHFEMLPAKRVEAALADGSVDLQCLMAPAWWANKPPHLHWSVPVLPLRDVLVTAPDGPPTMQAFEQGGRWTVGTVRGYVYPKLSEHVAAGRWVLDEAFDQWAVLEKLVRNRTAAGVVNEWTLKAYNRRTSGQPLRVLKVLDEVNAHCIISSRGAVPVEHLQRVIRRWVDQGGVQKVLEPYQ